MKWTKARGCESAHCLEVGCGDGACVEVGSPGEGAVSLRGTGPLSNSDVITVTSEEFRVFVTGAKAGDFDHL
jgi:hypothetical protein